MGNEWAHCPVETCGKLLKISMGDGDDLVYFCALVDTSVAGFLNTYSLEMLK